MMVETVRKSDAAREEPRQSASTRKGGSISLVQFDPELVRMERINVGLILLVPGEPPRVRAGVSGDRLHAAGVAPHRIASVRSDVASFARRFLRENPTLDAPADLDRWGARLGNHLLLTPARGISLLDPDADLDRLYRERVEDLSVRPTLAARVESLFSRPDVRPFIERDREVSVPELRRVHAPYAYRNGVLNLVRPVPLDPRAEETAGYWRLVGRLLKASSDPTARGARVELLLAAAHTPEESAIAQACREVLAGSDVAVYEEPAFAEYEAHVESALRH